MNSQRKIILLSPAYDSDALAFFRAASISGKNERAALNQFVKDLKGKGATANGSYLWSKIYALYPYCPISFNNATASAYSWNLINQANFKLTWNNFVAGDFTYNGVTGGATKYAQTGIIPSSVMELDNAGITAYCGTNLAGNFGFGVNNATLTNRIQLAIRLGTDQVSAFINTTTGVFPANTDARGLWDVQRTTSTASEIFKNGVSVATSAGASTALATREITLHARNNDGTIDLNDTKLFSGYGVRKSFNSNETADWFSAWNRYQTALGRNV